MSDTSRANLLNKLDDLRRNLALEIVEANDCGEDEYAGRLAEIDSVLFECESELRS